MLLPGMDGTGQLFTSFVREVSPHADVQVVRYETRGSAGYAQLAAQVRAQLPVDRDFVLLGESFSGPLAVMLASERPPGVKALVLCCTFLRNPRPNLARLRFLLALSTAGVRPPLGALAVALLGRYATPARREALRAALAEVSAATLRARLEAVIDVDVTALFETLSMPVLSLRATEDRVVPRAASLAMARARPGLSIVDFQAPHFLLQSLPAEAAAAVLQFMAAAASGPERAGGGCAASAA